MTQAATALTGARLFVPTENLPKISRRASKAPRTFVLLPMFDRKVIEAQIEALIDMLDRFDGDCDLEPDHEDYDICDLAEGGDYSDEAVQYGIDQSAGPINVFGHVSQEDSDFARLDETSA